MFYSLIKLFELPQVTRSGNELFVLIDEQPKLNATMTVSGDFISQVMYLGGLPPTTLPPSLTATTALVRNKRQLGTRNDNEDNNIGNRLSSEATNNNNNNEFNNVNSGFNNNDFTSTGFRNTNFDPTVRDNFADNSFSSSVGNNFEITFPELSSSSVRPDSETFRPEVSFDSVSPQSSFPSSIHGTDSALIPSSSPASLLPETTGFPENPITSTTEQISVHTGPVHFKGVLQDIRISNGTNTRLVQPFLLRGVESENFVLPGVNLNNTSIHNVLEGTISDAACQSSPCQNDATCNVTWNDYHCTCTFGFKGKNCDELEYCARNSCPYDSTCRNLMDGYECLANLTMNGVNSSLLYRSFLQKAPESINQISLNFRTQVGGSVLWLEYGLSSVLVGVTGDGVVVQQTNNSAVVTTVLASAQLLDGTWHHLNLTLGKDSSVQAIVDKISLDSLHEPGAVIIDMKSLVMNGLVRLGGGQDLLPGVNLIHEDYVESSAAPEQSAAVAAPLQKYFRGCLSEMRLQDILLPSFPPQLLENDTALNKFEISVSIL